MNCPHCGKEVPYAGGVCPYCHQDKHIGPAHTALGGLGFTSFAIVCGFIGWRIFGELGWTAGVGIGGGIIGLCLGLFIADAMERSKGIPGFKPIPAILLLVLFAAIIGALMVIFHIVHLIRNNFA
jgi:hypothetical protein